MVMDEEIVQDSIEVLGREGHLSLTWDPTNPEDVERAREEVNRLKEAGYSFFAVLQAEEGKELEQGDGSLVVRRIDDPLSPPPEEASIEKKKKPPNSKPPMEKKPKRKARKTVAMRPMRGG